MSYSAQNIRNICLLGHGGNGKTSLAESILYQTGAIDRMGKVTDGNTTSDYDPEEIRRQFSISTSVIPVEYKGCKINILDTPGYFDFAGEVTEALRVADAAVIVCSAKSGISVGAEKAWKYCEAHKIPRILYISKTDEDNSDYNAAFDSLRERFGKNIAPVVAPIWDEDKRVIGIIDVLNKRAYDIENGKRHEIPVPENKQDVLDELYNALVESVAETSEEFMERYFNGEEFTYAEMIQGLHTGVKDLSLFPVVCGSAITGLGTQMLLDNIVNLLPSPLEGRPETGEDDHGDIVEFAVSPGAVPVAFVWKTVSDQYGKYSYVKVLSGTIEADMPIVNARTGLTEKLGRLYVVRGKKTEEVKKISCGDIGAVGKMDKVKTGDTLCDPRNVIKLAPMDFPEPVYSMAIRPKVKGQDDKVAAGLNRLNEEDQTFPWSTTPRPARWSSPAPATSSWTCWSPGSSPASAWTRSSPRPVSPTGRRSARRWRSRAATRSRPAATASSATCGSASSPASRTTWSSAKRWSAAPCPRTTSPPWRRASGKPWPTAPWRATPW